MKNTIEKIEQFLQEENTREKGFGEIASGVTMNVWNNRRVYFNLPGASRKYADVGYYDLENGKIAVMGTPINGFKARTTDEKAYVAFMGKVKAAAETK